ncbi:DiGeorge syndrome critical region protein 6-like protein [Willisornis vidua]|uniref:DiGeorge syndrome critical region protein 6-like protein n=1 Tax=Willisornis vidua TaxID=1566151 RepID=A0ABQ9DQF3_9PASS|nr:DiGeorge syndrome critical region protein 6-like protein [Willisornis vidua]
MPVAGLKQKLFHRHKEVQQCCRPHNLPLLRAAQQREMEVNTPSSPSLAPEQRGFNPWSISVSFGLSPAAPCLTCARAPKLEAALQAMEQRIREEQRMMDEKIVLELDQKVIDQQSTLEKAGVSGFYITTNPQELTLQMNLLELIRKLQQKEAEAEKAFS